MIFHIYFSQYGGLLERILWQLIFCGHVFIAAFIIIAFVFIYKQFLIQIIIIFTCLKFKILVDCIIRIMHLSRR